LSFCSYRVWIWASNNTIWARREAVEASSLESFSSEVAYLNLRISFSAIGCFMASWFATFVTSAFKGLAERNKNIFRISSW
jgi:hypothetical protein